MVNQKTKLLVSSTINTVKTAVVIWTTALFVGGVVLAVAIVSSNTQPTGTISFSKASINAGESVDITVNATAPIGSKITSITVNTGDPEDSEKYTKSCSARTCVYVFSKTYDPASMYNVRAAIVSKSSSRGGTTQTIYINKNIVVEKGIELLATTIPNIGNLIISPKTNNITTKDWVEIAYSISLQTERISYIKLNSSADLDWECDPAVSYCKDEWLGGDNFIFYSPDIHWCGVPKLNSISTLPTNCQAIFKVRFKNSGQYNLSAYTKTYGVHPSGTRWVVGNRYYSAHTTLNVTGAATTPDDDTVPPITEPPKPVPPSVSISATPADPVCTSVGCKQSVTIIVTTAPGDNPISSISISDGSSSWSNLIFSKEYDINPNGTSLLKSFQATVTDDKGLSSNDTASVFLMVPKDPIGTLTFTSGNSMTLGGTIAIVAKLNNKDAKVNLELVSGDKSLLKPTLLETRNCKSNGDKTCITTPPWNIATYGDKPNPTDQTYTFKATFTTGDGKPPTTATAKLTIKKKEALQCPF